MHSTVAGLFAMICLQPGSAAAAAVACTEQTACLLAALADWERCVPTGLERLCSVGLERLCSCSLAVC